MGLLNLLFGINEEPPTGPIPIIEDAIAKLSYTEWKTPISILDELQKEGYDNPTKHLRGQIFGVFSGLKENKYLEVRFIPDASYTFGGKRIEYKKNPNKKIPVKQEKNTFEINRDLSYT